MSEADFGFMAQMVAIWFTDKYRYSKIADNAAKVTSVTDRETTLVKIKISKYAVDGGGIRSDLSS